MSNISALSAYIREEALRLGFFKTGISFVRPLSDEEPFNAWLKSGLHGEMRYLERQAPKRRDPGLVLSNARSMLVCAMNYYTGYDFQESPMKGKISRYCLGDDYHSIVKSRLEKLLEFIQSHEPNARGLCYVDTGPVMEKVWGAKSALGWIGKHANLISRDQGSWFFIGVILLDIELQCDSQEKSFCGSCSRCIHACPTGAIVDPYVLDARRCISYLTIELRGPIPRHLRSLIGNRIYGCDDCQEVCPWNRWAVQTHEKGFYPREGNWMPDLIPLVRLSPEEFKNRFENSPILRVARDGFVRNVVIALGNSGNEEAIPGLEEALWDASPLVRSHAAWALGQIATKYSIRILASALINETNAFVRSEIAAALEKAKTELQ
jgi:epoxyqueuosine reductase